MTGEAARQAFLDWLARERRAAVLTVEAYGGDLAGFLGFLTGHLGAEPDLDALRTLRLADLRAWLAHEANAGAGERHAGTAPVGGAQLLPLPGAPARRGQPGGEADHRAAREKTAA